MFNKESLLNQIDTAKQEHDEDTKAKYAQMADDLEKAYVNLRHRNDDIKDMCEVACAYLLNDPNASTVYAGSHVMFIRGCCGRNGYGVDKICAIAYMSNNVTLVYFPDGTVEVSKSSLDPLMHSRDVTAELMNIRSALRKANNDAIVRVDDNQWVHAWTIAEAVVAISKHLDQLKENLEKAVKHETDEDVVVWKDGETVLKFPRLTKDERETVNQFVHKVPPNLDSVSNGFNLLIRFARETIDQKSEDA